MPRRAAKKPAPAPASLAAVKVLAVDDDPASLKLLDVVLRGEGCDVRTAASGEEALDVLAAGFEPALAVIDLVLPRMNGFVLAAKIQARPTPVRIVAVSAINGPGTERAARAAGCAAMLRKPIDLSTFPAVLLAALRGK